MKLEIKNPNYAAIVVKVSNTIPLEGFDRVHAAIILGNQVIVDKSVTKDTIGLYFPVECQLSKEYLSNNNLYRKPELNKDNTKKGYFEENGRVRCVKFKDNKSEGLFMPLESLTFLNCDLPLTIGHSFDKINGVEICRKYIIKMRQSNSTGKSNKGAGKLARESKLVDGQFRFHDSTEMLYRNLHKIDHDTIISITYKMHGCFERNTSIRMWDGNSKKISKIKKGDIIQGVKDGKIVQSIVKNVWVNGNTKDWVKVYLKYKEPSLYGNKRNYIMCTPNHKFLTYNNVYKEICNFKVGDVVYNSIPIYKLKDFHKQVLIGKLLGDGYLDLHNKSYSIVYGHKESHFKYLEYCSNLLNNISTGNYRHRVSGYGTKMIDTRTKHDYSINLLSHAYFDFNAGKHLKPSIVDIFNEVSAAFWYMDDGSIIHSDYQKDRISIATCGFNEEDCTILVKCLNKIGVEAKITNHDYYRIHINNKNAEIFWNKIKKYIPEIMQYKLPEKFRGNYEFVDIPVEKDNYLFPNTVLKIESYTSKYNFKKYDLETETVNYFAGNTLVHNSSGISSKVLCKKPLKWYEKILKILGVNIVDTTYDYIYASRRVIKNNELNPNANHYYNEDIWGLAHNEVKEYLQDGMTFYYEIVGFLPYSGGYIQKDYDYGCEPNKFKVYIYRITYTNPSGKVFEFDSQQVQSYCHQYGLNPVVELFYGRASELFSDNRLTLNKWRERFLQVIKDNYNEKTCCMCHSADVPEEGVVIRVEDSLDFKAFKQKSTAFYERETKLLDKGESNIEDEN